MALICYIPDKALGEEVLVLFDELQGQEETTDINTMYWIVLSGVMTHACSNTKLFFAKCCGAKPNEQDNKINSFLLGSYVMMTKTC